jgi:hypothetical protein
MQVHTFQCPKCSFLIVIEPMETPRVRSKQCNNPKCGPKSPVDFSFMNNELVTYDVPEDLARRGYFKDSEIQ